MSGQNYSKQREAIYSFLSGRKDHPTADVVYENIRKELPAISLGTVYRNLRVLCEAGRIRKVDCGDGLDHFDANTLVHQHFICEECGKIEDIFLGDLGSLKTMASDAYGGRVVSTDVVFRGICPECAGTKAAADQ